MPLYLYHMPYTDSPNLLSSTLFFPNDDRSLTQLYNFTKNVIKVHEDRGDVYFSRISQLAAWASVFQTFGLDFTPKVWEGYGIIANNRFSEMFEELCYNCTMLNVAKIGTLHITLHVTPQPQLLQFVIQRVCDRFVVFILCVF